MLCPITRNILHASPEALQFPELQIRDHHTSKLRLTNETHKMIFRRHRSLQRTLLLKHKKPSIWKHFFKSTTLTNWTNSCTSFSWNPKSRSLDFWLIILNQIKVAICSTSTEINNLKQKRMAQSLNLQLPPTKMWTAQQWLRLPGRPWEIRQNKFKTSPSKPKCWESKQLELPILAVVGCH